MKYAITLDSSNRILQAAEPDFAPLNTLLVDELPEGNIHDFKYIGGSYEYDPLPLPEEARVDDPILQRFEEIEAAVCELAEKIAGGE